VICRVNRSVVGNPEINKPLVDGDCFRAVRCLKTLLYQFHSAFSAKTVSAAHVLHSWTVPDVA
jgi:hypothetical protein